MFEHTLSMGARGGPAEVFLRRTSAYSAEFDGDRTNGLRHDRRAELAVRVFRKGRYGLAGSSFDSLFDPIRLIRQAECQAQHGPPSPPIETPPSKGGHRGPVPLRPSELVEAIDCLRVTLCKWSPRDSLVRTTDRDLAGLARRQHQWAGPNGRVRFGLHFDLGHDSPAAGFHSIDS